MTSIEPTSRSYSPSALTEKNNTTKLTAKAPGEDAELRDNATIPSVDKSAATDDAVRINISGPLNSE